MSVSRADPGPVVGGGANPSKGGANLIYFIFVLKNLIKLQKFWSVAGGGRVPEVPPCNGLFTLHDTENDTHNDN